MAKAYSVTQVNNYIKNMFANDFVLNNISVEGEVSNCKYHTSGHIYFTIKDQGGTLSAVMFAGQRRGLSFTMQEGMKVVVKGSIEVYVKGGSFQIYAQKIEKAGIGDLYERFTALKNELEEMGMFSREYKKPIPKFASSIGIVTALTGAAIQDIMNIAKRRNPYVQLVLFPAIVQGENAPDSIVRGIKVLDLYGVDVIIVGRGGGSIEDLWAFNEERVARAIFEADTPIISAVGHETDFTIADFVSDLRAPTPSAAAELATIDFAALEYTIKDRRDTISSLFNNRLLALKNKLEQKCLRLNLVSPKNRLKENILYTEELRQRLSACMKSIIEDRRHNLAIGIEKLKGLSPLDKISSGYAFVTDKEYKRVKSVKDIKKSEELILNFSDGKVYAKAMEVIYEKR